MKTVTTLDKQRFFIDKSDRIATCEDVEKYYQILLDENPQNETDLILWLKKRSELEAFVSEEGGWRYIHMTINTADKEAALQYENFITRIDPVVSALNDKLNEKLLHALEKIKIKQPGYDIYFRGIRNEKSLFRKENIPVITEINQATQRYAALVGAQNIEHDNKTLTLPQAGLYLRSSNRDERKTVYEKISKRRQQDANELNRLFDSLIILRSRVATTAGFPNFRDYKFRELGRFDYGVKECENLHESIRSEIVPLVKQFHLERKQKLGYPQLLPWDLETDISGKPPLHPFSGENELIQKTTSVFQELDPYFGQCLKKMEQLGHFDLVSKANKAPGGYNYPLYESGAPFIFMNAVGTQRDMVTMVHEGGHAVHSFLTHPLELTGFKSFPSEVAELASMGMELISMNHWDMYYTDPDELRRAKKDQLEKIISLLPWIATVDAFQHWIYTHPGHSAAERNMAWMQFLKTYSTGVIDYNGLEWTQENSWQRQLHIFEVPFYYIEYAIAQLGAIAIWRNYCTDAVTTIQQYRNALSLGYTKTLPEIYKAAGIEFNFTTSYIRELAGFVKNQYAIL